jgi:hypothetical protein
MLNLIGVSVYAEGREGVNENSSLSKVTLLYAIDQKSVDKIEKSLIYSVRMENGISPKVGQKSSESRESKVKN